jgi:hypothetical protein
MFQYTMALDEDVRENLRGSGHTILQPPAVFVAYFKQQPDRQYESDKCIECDYRMCHGRLSVLQMLVRPDHGIPSTRLQRARWLRD